jgi:hypothetical protein
MPNLKSDYPLTLAEILFGELETTNGADLEGFKTELASVKERLGKIKDLPDLTPEDIRQICIAEEITINSSGADLDDLIWKCKTKLSAALVPDLYKIIRRLPQNRSALCLSGGGVRSATFNLGVLQGLSRYGLLDKFDFLSTVSGGGFIGGWLSAWIHRQEHLPEQLPVSRVAARLADPPDDPLQPEPDPVYNLRVYANYLTPRKGLLSVDTWTLIAVYLRNLLLNWMVFLPAIIAFLMLPRIWVAFVRSTYLSPTLLLWAGFAGAVIALIYIGLNLPGAKRLNLGQGWFVFLCLVPLILSAMALTTYWIRLSKAQQPGWESFTLFALILAAVPWALYLTLMILARMRDRKKKGDDEDQKHPESWLRFFVLCLLATTLIFAAFAITGYLIWYLVTTQLPASLNLQTAFLRTYASLAVPFFLVLLTVGGTLISGFTSRFTDVDDQEWWARSGAWILIVVVGWSVFHVLVLFGPALFVELQAQLINNQSWSTWSGLKGLGAGLIGIVSGAITLFGGSSGKTPAHDDAGGSKRSLAPLITAVAATVFGAFLLILLALACNWILASSLGEWAGKILRAGAPNLNANDPRAIIYHAPGRVLVAMALLIAVVGWILGRFINTNRFSLHYYWRNRLMRAYLGASRKRAKTKNKFTDFDGDDNVQMYELQQKPLHVVNVTLNLAGGEKLEWQDRKAESFAISPLHSGSYFLGYRDSAHYGGHDGISLATSAAISGAAASPNMGYMMTSPVVRFIMTLFNVRLGFWLGNPGMAGSGSTMLNPPTFNRDSPTQSVRPIFSEALGLTNGQSPYVYLSDGGHFDNLGLYEMILRRCRYIVVSDASTDPTYCFDSLAYSIRQVRTDFGVPIEMEEMNLGKNPDNPNKYCAIGRIRYSCVDKPVGSKDSDADYDGVLIYIKPSLNGSEPADVLNFHSSDDAFPQDTIADQWFSEPQFESYRMLGSHMIETICPNKLGDSDKPLEGFTRQVRKHLADKPEGESPSRESISL